MPTPVEPSPPLTLKTLELSDTDFRLSSFRMVNAVTSDSGVSGISAGTSLSLRDNAHIGKLSPSTFWSARGDRATANRYVATAALLLTEQHALSLLRESLLLEARLVESDPSKWKDESGKRLARGLVRYYQRDGRFIRQVRQLSTQLDRRFVR